MATESSESRTNQLDGISELEFPFVYISALMRTGGTLLAEALTQLPYCFILNETHLGKNRWSLDDLNIAAWQPNGIDLRAFVRWRHVVAFLNRRLRPFGRRQDYMLRQFKLSLVPRLSSHVRQLGVKEIRHQGWEHYVRHFPNIKVIMVGRDPRDIYLSMRERILREGLPGWLTALEPSQLVSRLMLDFQLQLELRQQADCLLVRYEDLCEDPAVFEKIKRFVSSPLPTIGEIGSYTGKHVRRQPENLRHGTSVTPRSVRRWQREPDREARAEAQHCFKLMGDYTDFWGYDRDGACHPLGNT